MCKCNGACKCKNPKIKLQIKQKNWTDEDMINFAKLISERPIPRLQDLLKDYKNNK